MPGPSRPHGLAELLNLRLDFYLSLMKLLIAMKVYDKGPHMRRDAFRFK
jgi:hypothetical protein